MTDLTYNRILTLAMLDSLRRGDIPAYQRVACNPYTPQATVAAALILADRMVR